MPDDQTIRYQPALDGVRALAVIAVLLFHGGLAWMSGGYLGVSVFFTLSGFLITSLLLREGDATGRIDVVRFYTRRARRLLPASLVCIVAVCVLAAAGAFAGVAGLRRDVLGALLQVFNWVKLGSGESYADLNNLAAGLRHPLDHYWSLAIEEQFYWVWPVTFIGVLRLRRRHPRWTVLRTTVVLFLTFAVAAPVIAAAFGANAAYWATPARAAEILSGAVLACWYQRRITAPEWSRWIGGPCLAALVAACVLFPDGSGPAYRGLLPLIGIVSAGLILGLQPAGPLRSMLSLRPLVVLGRISYGIYLYHWPIYVLIDRRRWDLPVGISLSIKIGITLVVATLSYRFVERPIRRTSTLPPRRTLVLGLAGTAAVAAMIAIVPNPAKFYAVNAAAAQQAQIGTDSVAPLIPLGTTTAQATSAADPTEAPTTTASTTIAPATAPDASTTAASTPAPASTATAPVTDAAVTTTPAPVPPRPVRILVVGDSTAEATGNGLIAWAAADPALAQVSLSVREGCGFVLGGYIPYGQSGDRDVDAECSPWLTRQVPAAVRKLRPDVVVLLTTSWDVLDRKLTRHSDPVLPVTDPVMRPVVDAAMANVTRQVLDAGASRIVWLREPIADPYWLHLEGGQRDPANHQVLYDEMAALAAADPAVRVVDLAGWVDTARTGGATLATDTSARPDGVHWTPDAAQAIATDFLGPAILREALS